MSSALDQSVPVARIRPPPHQLRETIDPAAVGTLADDIGARGLLQRIGVRGPMLDGLYEIVWGHRRWLAVQLLGREEIEARVFPRDFDPLLASVSENLQREQLTPLEEARLVARLLEAGSSLREVARQLRRTPQWVEGRALLAAAPADIQQAVHERAIPLGVAYALIAIDDEGYRKDLIDEARRLGATVAVAQVWVAEYARDRVQLLRTRQSVSELIQRAATIQATTDCGACGRPVPWAQIEQLRLCPPCYAGVQAALLAGEAGAPGRAP